MGSGERFQDSAIAHFAHKATSAAYRRALHRVLAAWAADDGTDVEFAAHHIVVHTSLSHAWSAIGKFLISDSERDSFFCLQARPPICGSCRAIWSGSVVLGR